MTSTIYQIYYKILTFLDETLGDFMSNKMNWKIGCGERCILKSNEKDEILPWA